MKRYLILLFFIGLCVAACTSNKADTTKQDSLSADAAADSMLNEALKADSVTTDADSI